MALNNNATHISKSTTALIDVDCNLFHADFRSIKKMALKTTKDDDTNDNADHWADLLDEDNPHDFNLVALLSPSSTALEAQIALPRLRDRTRWTNVRIRSTVGVHPYHVNNKETPQSIESAVATMRHLIAKYPTLVAAVGECGLDTTDGFPPLAAQLPWFRAQVRLAADLAAVHHDVDLPLFVHERGAQMECLQILEDELLLRSDRCVPVIIHCFTGTVDECRVYVDRGYHISLSGAVYKMEALQQCLERDVIPLDRLMIETDAPYMGFDGCRSRYLARNADWIQANLNAKTRKRLSTTFYPNVPSALPLVLDKVLHHVNVGRKQRHEAPITLDQLARLTTRNANAFFGFGLDEFDDI